MSDVHDLAETIASMIRGRPGATATTQNATVTATIDSATYTIAVRHIERHACPHDGITYKTAARLAEHMENVHHHYADLETAP